MISEKIQKLDGKEILLLIETSNTSLKLRGTLNQGRSGWYWLHMQNSGQKFHSSAVTDVDVEAARVEIVQ